MAINYAQQSEGYAGAYAISASPFVTSSYVGLGEVKEIQFGYISRFLVVRNTSPSGVISIGFTRNGLLPQNSNYFFLSGSESFSGDFRSDRLFISGSEGTCNFTIVSGLTTIPAKMLTTITGSNGFPGVG